MIVVKPSRREESARATRRAVLDAATELFVKQGWATTTVEQIAAHAGVSRPTVFALGSKADLLRLARDVAMAGDDRQITVHQRASVQRVLAAPDPQSWARRLAVHIATIAERYGPLDEVLRQAAGADAELARLWATSEQQRRTGASLLVEALPGVGAMSTEQRSVAVDVLWVLMAPDCHSRLVRARGWAQDRYVTWLTGAILALVVEPFDD